MAELEKVRVRDCECPNKPHNGEGDWVALAPTLSLEGGLAAEQDLRDANSILDENERGASIQRRWIITFVKYGAKAWNFVDENGEERPFDIAELLNDYAIARPVADKASDLYADSVLRPFLTRLATRSPTGRTAGTTSKAQRRTRTQSKPSSPDTTADSTQSPG